MADSATELAVLKTEFEHLKIQVAEDEANYSSKINTLSVRVSTLEIENKTLNDKLRVGRGFLLGLFFSVGSGVLLTWDVARTALVKWFLG